MKRAFKALRHRLRSAWYARKGYIDVRIDGERFQCDPGNWRYWRNLNRQAWEPHTLRIYRALLTPQDHYLDIGAFIGPTAMFASRLCRAVYCLEPDPLSFQRLQSNIARNGIRNIQAAQFGVYTENRTFYFGSQQGLGTSSSHLLPDATEGATRIQCVTLAEVRKMWDLPPLKLIKIDIEGAEFELIPQIAAELFGMSDYVYLSTHSHLLPPVEGRAQMERLLPFFRQYTHIYDEHLRLVPAADICREDYLQTSSEFLCAKVAVPALQN